MTESAPPAEQQPEEHARMFVRQCTAAEVAADVFEFADPANGHARAFGGLQMAQALAAAARTVSGYVPHSLHQLFLQRVGPDHPVRYEVERVRNGRSFATRRVRLMQQGRIAGDTLVSFTRTEDGLTYDGTMPDVPAPEDSARYLLREEFAQGAEHRRQLDDWHHPLQQRLAHRSDPGSESMPSIALWTRPPAPLPEDTTISAAYLAYISDMATVAVPTRHFPARQYSGTSLDHKLHLHHLPRMDDWMLFTRESPRSAGGRALVHGVIYSRDGMRLASCVQEVLVWESGRRPDPWERSKKA